MRKTLILLTSMLLAGCVDDSASYLINGNDHALTVRRQQNYFWKDEAAVSLLAARMPECQRLHQLADVSPAADVKVEVFAAGDDMWNLRMDGRLWQVEMATCEGLTEMQNDPNADLGRPVGRFVVKDGKLVFEQVPAAPASPAETAPNIADASPGA
jgi:hypothetical protein